MRDSPAEGGMPPRYCIVIAALSARALVHSAQRAGYRVHAIDAFADHDTCSQADTVTRVAVHSDGFDHGALLAAVEDIQSREPIAGLVYGGGFDGQPALLDRLAERSNLLGNPAVVTRAARDPKGLHALLAGADCPPLARTSLRLPNTDPGLWLVKHRGGCGGLQVRRAGGSDTAGEKEYYQLYRPGTALSALFLADGSRAELIGLHEQWCADPAVTATEFAFGGMVTRADLLPGPGADMLALAGRLASVLRLRGLNGIDCVLGPDGLELLELNPRPCASLALYDADHDGGLLHRHLEAVAGRLPGKPAPAIRCRGQQVVYAPRPIRIADGRHWPVWACDLPRDGTHVLPGTPLCSVRADGDNPAAVRRLLRERARTLLEQTLASRQRAAGA